MSRNDVNERKQEKVIGYFFPSVGTDTDSLLASLATKLLISLMSD